MVVHLTWTVNSWWFFKVYILLIPADILPEIRVADGLDFPKQVVRVRNLKFATYTT